MEEAKPPKRKSSAKRHFCAPVCSGKMGTICGGVVPPNTRKSTLGRGVFNDWRTERNKTATGEMPINATGGTSARSLAFEVCSGGAESRRRKIVIYSSLRRKTLQS